MTNLDPISLDTNWRYYPTEDSDPTYGSSETDEASWGVLDTLTDWPREMLPQSEILHLSHSFDLEPITDICLCIMLHVDAAPEGTTVYVNGWHVGTLEAGKSLVSDVTNYVSLDGNQILLKLSKKGDLHGVRIQPVPCKTD